MAPSPSIFSASEHSLALFAQALAHPARVALLLLLSDGQRRLSGELTGLLALPRTTVSQHLVTLRKLGLLQVESQGMLVWYSLKKEMLAEVKQAFSSFFEEFGLS